MWHYNIKCSKIQHLLLINCLKFVHNLIVILGYLELHSVRIVTMAWPKCLKILSLRFYPLPTQRFLKLCAIVQWTNVRILLLCTPSWKSWYGRVPYTNIIKAKKNYMILCHPYTYIAFWYTQKHNFIFLGSLKLLNG